MQTMIEFRGGGAPASNAPVGVLKENLAFTLAEVLITLGIIGIVAALTIPNLMGEYKKRVVETELKKSYTELAQVIQRSEVDNEAAIYWNWPYNGGTTGSLSYSPDKFFQLYFAPYMNISSKIEPKKFTVENIEGTYSNWVITEKHVTGMYELSDGRIIGLSTYTTITGDLINARENSNIGTYFLSTTNRKDKRLIAGKNFFTFSLQVKNKKLVPTVNVYQRWTCDYLEKNRNTFIERCRSNPTADGINSGTYCTFLIYCNNWEIPDDYPIKF